MKSLTSLALIVLSILVFFVYLRPAYATVSDLRAQKADYEDALVKSRSLQALQNSLTNQFESISPEDKSKLAAMIPVSFNSVKLVADINALAARYGMTVRSVSITKVTDTTNQSATSATVAPPPNPYKTASISFVVSGQYQNFEAFLKDLEANVELVDVRKLDIHTGAQTGSQNAALAGLDFGVTLETYYIN